MSFEKALHIKLTQSWCSACRQASGGLFKGSNVDANYYIVIIVITIIIIIIIVVVIIIFGFVDSRAGRHQAASRLPTEMVLSLSWLTPS